MTFRESLSEIIRAAAEVLRPAVRVPLSQWANENRRLSSEASAMPGQFRCFPFQVEVLDTLSPQSPYQQVVLMWASQMSKSECLLNLLAYIVAVDPGPVLMVQPNLVMGESFSKDRLGPMFRDTPALRGVVADPRGRDSGSTIAHRRFRGGHVSIVGSNSPAGLASRPIRFLLLDECDRFEASAGGEGDAASLAIARTRSFWNRKIVMCSSPSVKGASRIEAAFEESDQRYFHVPCPHCNVRQVLRWPRVEWPEGRPQDAAYRCAHCEKLIPHHKKAWMVSRGKWIAANPKSPIAGFHLSELVSPWRSWAELVDDWLASQGSIERLRVFLNTSLCECWDDQSQIGVGIDTLLARRSQQGPFLPQESALLTAGVDVQADRIELELVAFGRGEESWSIEHRVFPGDPSGPEPWRALDQFLLQTWPHPSGLRLPISAVCIDSGYATQAVYDFCRTRYGRRVFAVKGRSGPHPVWPKKPSRAAGRTPLHLIGVDSAKASILGRLKIDEPGPGFMHFPTERTVDYFEQLLSEVLVTKYSRGVPIREWRRKKGARAEVLDTWVYALAALQSLVSFGLMLDQEVDRLRDLEQSLPAAEVYPVARSRWMGSRH